MNVRNLLEEWRSEMYARTSHLALKRYPISRSKIGYVHSTLKKFFPRDFFEVPMDPRLSLPEVVNSNWLHGLLANFNKLSVVQLIEIASVLNYYENEDSLVSRLIGLSRIKEFRQFRNFYFELSTFYRLESNGFKVDKKGYEGSRELEGVITYHGREYLIECKKLYAYNVELPTSLNYLAEQLALAIRKYPMSLSGSLLLTDNDISQVKGSLQKKILPVLRIMYTGKVGELQEVEVADNATLLLDYFGSPRLQSLTCESDCRIDFFIPTPLARTQNRVDRDMGLHFEINYTLSNGLIREKLLKAIRQKRKDRRGSTYRERIFFFENEISKNLDHPLIPNNRLFPETKKSIQKYIDGRKTHDLVYIVFKNSFDERSSFLRVEFFKNHEFDDIDKDIASCFRD